MIVSAALQKVDRYVDDVLSGNVVTCQLVQQAVQRYVNDLQKQSTKDFPYHYDKVSAEIAIEFIENMICHSIGDFQGMPFLLERWQAFAVANIFGWKRDDDNSRRFRKVYWSMGRKNGKSCIGAAIAIMMASFDLNPKTGNLENVAEVVLSATKKEQAKVIYSEIERMRAQSRHISDMSTNINKEIKFRHNLGSIRCLGSDKPFDGLNPTCCIKDELHAWRETHRKFYDTLETGSGSRSQPLLLTLTTAGDDKSNIWMSEFNYAKSILADDFKDEQFFGYHFQIDEDKDVLDPANWIMANPNLHVSLKPDYLEQLAIEASHDELALNRFKRYHANQLVSSTSRAFNLDEWDRGEGTLSDWSKAEAIGCGIDLGGRDDFCSYSLVARFSDGYGESGEPVFRYEGRTYAYIATDTKRDLGVKPFSEWVHKDLLQVTKYPVSKMLVDMLEHLKAYRVDSVAYDPYNGQQISEEIEQQGFEIARMSQTCQMFHAPICEFKEVLASNRFRHDGNPLLRWCVGNAVLVSDSQNRVMFSKRDSSEKIDPVVSLHMAFWRASVAPRRATGSLLVF
jgi:phage terminase large subunit-like protein